MDYRQFLERKAQLGSMDGFAPNTMPSFLFDFQQVLVEWALQKGKAAIFADCGLGKTLMQLVWAENVVRHTNGRVLILTPLAVGVQTLAEGKKFGIECERSRTGELPAARIVITNYEQLHKFSPTDFVGMVCDESSILKHFSGATQKAVTRFMLKLRYRLLCTATAAPNDYVELGTSSEALGLLGYTDMLSRFFRQSDGKVHRTIIKDQKEQRISRAELGNNYFGKLAFRAAQQIGQWRLKGHAEVPFWRWLASWARACRRPSDLGFDDRLFELPAMTENYHIVEPRRPRDGMLFTLPAVGLGEEREERRRTLDERCELAAELSQNGGSQAVVWVQYNPEGDLLERLIPGAVQIAGCDSDEAKEERLLAFISGEARYLITKAKIAGFGLNMQQCSRVITFATHSYESYYQSIRRCWRFGQKSPVSVDIISTVGEQRVVENMRHKAQLMSVLFDRMVEHMNQAVHIDNRRNDEQVEVPQWLKSN